MIRGLKAILIGSQNAKKLAEFYEKVVGLKLTFSAKMGDKGEEAYSFEMKRGSSLYILDHSKVKGKNTHPDRIMFNLEVDNIEKEVKRVKKAKVKVVKDTYHVEDYGLIATFEDVDGNYFQFVKVREN